MNKISTTVLNKIKKAKISPIPKWRFIAMHVLLWSITLGSIIVGSIAISVIIKNIVGAEWDVVRRAGRNSVHSFIMIIPYIWFLLLGLILFVANKLFIKTKKGYRYKPIYVVCGSIIISLLAGVALHFAGAGHAIERGLMQNIGPYAKWQEKRDRMFVTPDQGVLVGKVVQVIPNKNLIVIDFKSTKWTVDTSKAKFKNDFEPQINFPVGVLGEKTSKTTFKADKVLPWRPKMQKGFKEMRRPPVHRPF